MNAILFPLIAIFWVVFCRSSEGQVLVPAQAVQGALKFAGEGLAQRGYPGGLEAAGQACAAELGGMLPLHRSRDSAAASLRGDSFAASLRGDSFAASLPVARRTFRPDVVGAVLAGQVSFGKSRDATASAPATASVPNIGAIGAMDEFAIGAFANDATLEAPSCRHPEGTGRRWS